MSTITNPLFGGHPSEPDSGPAAPTPAAAPAPAYPPYVPAPSNALLYGPEGGPLGPASPDILCLLADAQAVMAKIQPLYTQAALYLVETFTNSSRVATPTLPAATASSFYYLYPENELRRVWMVILPSGEAVPAQNVIDGENSQGVGAPMVPSINTAGNLVWTLTPSVPTSNQSVIASIRAQIAALTAQLAVLQAQ